MIKQDEVVSTRCLQSTSRMHVEILHGTDALVEIAGDWDNLFDRAVDAPPYLSHTWASTFIHEGRLRGKPLFIVVWYRRKLVGLFPLAVRKFLALKIAEPIGTGEASYLGVLVDRKYPSAVECMAELITSRKIFDVYLTADLSFDDVPTNDLLAKLVKRGYFCRQLLRNPCPYIQLDCSFNEYLSKHMSSRSRCTLRREERRLFRRADVKVEHYVGEQVTGEMLGRIAKVGEESWMKKRGAAVLGQPFYQNLLSKMDQSGLGCLWLMTIDGDDAAFLYAFIAHRKLYFHWTAFKLRYKSLSIGKSLMMHTIRDACSDNILSIDLGQGDAEYKRFWAGSHFKVNRAILGKGLRAWLIAICYSAVWRLAKKKWLRRIYHRLRKLLKG